MNHIITRRARSLRLLLGRRSIQSLSHKYESKIDASALRVIKADSLKDVPEEVAAFGVLYTDYMLEIDWTSRNGWQDPVIKPLENLSLHPGTSSLQYSIQCFEGMKAYKGENDELRLFRPDMNLKRFQTSMKRVQLPEYDQEGFFECLEEYVKLEQRWVPKSRENSLYLRPTAISTEPTLGVATPKHAKMYVIASQVGAYFPEGFQSVALIADKGNVRAWPGGTGEYKIGGNYAPTIAPLKEANTKGYSQVLWLYQDQVTEVGTMNVMCLWKNKNGDTELVTAPLDGTILPGVTRDSVINIVRSWGITVIERSYTMTEVAEAAKEDRMIEMFGCGTACVVCPINKIRYDDKDIDIPVKGGVAGELAQKVWDHLLDIQTGRVEHEYSHVIKGTGSF